VALIDVRRGFDGPPLSEHNYTKLLLAYGFAELAESEKIRGGNSAQGERAKRPAEPVETLAPDVSQTLETTASEGTTACVARVSSSGVSRSQGKRTKTLLLRLTPDEHALIKSQRNGKAVAQWIRESAVERALLARDSYDWNK
jgi:hypothetical protein